MKNKFEEIIKKIEAPEENQGLDEIKKIEEWKAKRVGRVTASQLPKFMKSGRSKGEVFGKEAIKVLIQTKGEIRTGESLDDDLEVYAMRWGKEFEPLALEKVKEIFKSAKGGSEGDEISFNTYGDIFGDSPDFEGENYIGEIKCPISRVKIEMQRDPIDFINEDKNGKRRYHDYFWQMVGHLVAKPEAEKCIYVVYDAYIDEAYFHVLERIAVSDEINQVIERLEFAKKVLDLSKNDNWSNFPILNINENF